MPSCMGMMWNKNLILGAEEVKCHVGDFVILKKCDKTLQSSWNIKTIQQGFSESLSVSECSHLSGVTFEAQYLHCHVHSPTHVFFYDSILTSVSRRAEHQFDFGLKPTGSQ